MGERENAVDGALMAIDLARWGASRARIVLFVKVNTLGNPDARAALVPLGYREVAEGTGLEARWVHRQLEELVDQRVLDRVAEAAGSRGAAYEVNLAVREWRVPWAVPRELALTRVAWLAGDLRGANPSVAPRWGAAQTRIATRRGAAVDRASAALGRGTTGALVPRWGAAQTRGLSSSLESPYGLSLSDQEGSEENTTGAIVIDAIARHTGRPVYGSLPSRVHRAVVGLDPGPFVVAIKRTDGDLPPRLVDLVEQLAGAERRQAEEGELAAPVPRCSSCDGRGWVEPPPPEPGEPPSNAVLPCPACRCENGAAVGNGGQP